MRLLRDISLFCFFLFVFLAVTSCSPQKRLNRIVKNNPHLAQLDTTFLVDTIVIHDYSVDTVTKIVEHDSVVVIDNEKVILKYFYDTLRQEIYHDVVCKGDSIVKEYEIVHDYIKVEKGVSWWAIIICVIIILFLLYLLTR